MNEGNNLMILHKLFKNVIILWDKDYFNNNNNKINFLKK